MHPPIDPAGSELLARLYRGIGDDPPWQGFLEALARWMDASFATLIITAPGMPHPATFLTPGGDSAFAQAYAASLFADDPFQGLPDGLVADYGEFMAALPDEAFADYRQTMADRGFEQVLGIDLRFGAGASRGNDRSRYEARLRVSRHKSLPGFVRGERARLQSLVPHLRIAVGLFEKLQFAGAQDGVFHAAAQGLGLALIVLDRNQRVVSSNPLANSLLEENEGIVRQGDGLVFANPAHQRVITGLLASSASQSARSRFRILRPEAGDLLVTARPLALSAIHASAGALALFLARTEAEPSIDPADLSDLFGLTPAEARLAAGLAEGMGLVEAAKCLGIAHNTAKAQLRAVFAKTGVKRQSQLAALLASLGG
jgi:DNA-binding CsgD family transcriptional regulator